MAIFAVTLTPLVLPPKHSRGYTRSNKGVVHILRRRAVSGKYKDTFPNPTEYSFFQTDARQADRAYHRMITRWWSSGNIPNGVAFWDALAAANPIVNHKDQSRTVNAFRWFTWYQRRMLALNGYTWAPFHPSPLYYLAPPPANRAPFPDAPIGAWSQPAPPVINFTQPFPGPFLFINITIPPGLTSWLVATWWSWSPFPLGPAIQYPRYAGLPTFLPTTSLTWSIAVVEPFGVPWKIPGTRGRVYCAIGDAASQQFSDLASADFEAQ